MKNTVSRVITVVLKYFVRTQLVYLSPLHVKRKSPNTLVYFTAKLSSSSWRYLEALTDIQTPLGVISCIGELIEISAVIRIGCTYCYRGANWYGVLIGMGCLLV